jgi:nicotinamide-nucleotide amidase
MPFSKASLDLAQTIVERCTAKHLTLATAESCTGGLIMACLTDIPGSSAVVDRGFITYSNQAKQEVLGVPADSLAVHGAVSAEVAAAMATGARARADVDLAIAVTGIAGPGGGSEEKPVGLVYLSLDVEGEVQTVREVFPGDRQAVRLATLARGLGMIKARLDRI